MAKIPFSKIKPALTRYTTGSREPSAMAPGQNTPVAGQPKVNSVVQAADPDEVLNVVRQPRKTVLVVTPFAAEDPAKAAKMERYSNRAVKDSVQKVEAPMATGSFYYSVLNVRNPIERDTGLLCQLSWVKNCDIVAFYVDFGITPAMQVVLNAAMLRNKRIEFRTIGAVA